MVSFAKWMDDFCPADPKILVLNQPLKPSNLRFNGRHSESVRLFNF